MVASAAKGFQNTDPDTCATKIFGFHPEHDTAKFYNFVPWALLQANINFSMEIGHFVPGAHGDGDADDAPCFPGPTLAGCTNLNGDTDFDGTSYRRDWPDGTRANATSIAIRSVKGVGIGPLSFSANSRKYDQPFPIVQFETDVGASEAACQPNGVGCVVPPRGARFYPFFALTRTPTCALLFGNLSGLGIDTFGGDAQYGAPNLAHFRPEHQRTGHQSVYPLIAARILLVGKDRRLLQERGVGQSDARALRPERAPARGPTA
jgi:hypothetical protein